MLGGVLLQHVCVFFCQDANWHNPPEKILSCISTIFPLYPSKQSRSSMYCHQGKTPCPFSLDLQVGARQQQEGTALHGCLHSCLDATRKLGIQVLGGVDPSIPKDALFLLFFNGIEMENAAPCMSEADIPGELTGCSWTSQPCFSSCFPLVIQAFIFDTDLIRQVHLQTAFPYIPPCQDDVTLKTRLAKG